MSIIRKVNHHFAKLVGIVVKIIGSRLSTKPFAIDMLTVGYHKLLNNSIITSDHEVSPR